MLARLDPERLLEPTTAPDDKKGTIDAILAASDIFAHHERWPALWMTFQRTDPEFGEKTPWGGAGGASEAPGALVWHVMFSLCC